MIYPQPKTPRSERKKTQINTTGMPFGKRPRVVDPKYRLFVRQHPCALFSSAECRGQIVCAHLTPPGMASRSQKQSDAYTVPLCARHHDDLDLRNYVNPDVRNELLIICWARALELREVHWTKLLKEVSD